MKLLIDIGNTRLKWMCIDQQDHISKHQPAIAIDHGGDFDQCLKACFGESSEFSKVVASQYIDGAYIGNVAGQDAEQTVQQFLHENWQLDAQFLAVQSENFGIKNAYKYLSEMGVDRWLAILGSRKIISEGDVVVVNCGTAITVDFLTKDNLFMGGAILPGFQLAAKALSSTDGIAENVILQQDVRVGQTTAECVQLGVSSACIGGVEKIIKNISKNLSSKTLTVLLSGGAAPLMMDAWNNDSSFFDANLIKYQYDANVVIRGIGRFI